jgi:hypothetical protein
MDSDDFSRYPEKCRECLGCIQCDVEHCIFNSHGDPDGCYVGTCTYCHRFLRIQRLFLHNVG